MMERRSCLLHDAWRGLPCLASTTLPPTNKPTFKHAQYDQAHSLLLVLHHL